jgi:serine/threonine-protein kinase HipA
MNLMAHAAPVRRQAQVFLHGQAVGILEELEDGFRFVYRPEGLLPGSRPVSASLPVRAEPYWSQRLFPFFQGLLSEGELRRIQERNARLDEKDDFGLLLATCMDDAAGAVTVRAEVTA